jgi:hypothetical protein
MTLKSTWATGETVAPADLNAITAQVNANTTAIAASPPASLYGIPTLYIDIAGGALPADKVTYLTANFTLGGAPMTGGIRGRGSSTWLEPKKPYRIKLDASAALLGMPTSKHWCILANYRDQSMLRTLVAFEVGSRLSGMDWTPKSKFVDVVLNGVYNGLYQLCETVRFDPARVNATAATGTTGLTSTGAFLLEIDQYFDAPHGFHSTHDNLPITMDDPDGTDATAGAGQLTYITNWVNNFETVLYGSGWLDPVTGYAPLIDRDSFVDWYLANELVVSIDSGFQGSCKLYKTRDATGVPGKLFLGPMWDYDLALGKFGLITFSPEGWWVRATTNPMGSTTPGATWINRMLTDPTFLAAVQARWTQIVAMLSDINTFIDRAAQKIAMSRDNDEILWGDHGAWATEAQQIKDWLSARITWITGNLVTDVTAPSVPTGLASSSITSSGFTLNWTASTDTVGVTGYDISTDNGATVATTATTNSKAVTGLAASTAYQVKVRAKDAAGNASAYSSALSVTTSAGTSAPTPTSFFDFHEGSGGTTASIVSGGYTVSVSNWTRHTGGGALGPNATTSVWSLALDITFGTDLDGDIVAGNFKSLLGASGHYGFWTGSVLDTGTAITAGRKNLVLTYDGTNVRLYLAGTLQSTTATTALGFNPTSVLLLESGGDTMTDAVLRSVRFWTSTTLDGTQVGSLTWP